MTATIRSDELLTTAAFRGEVDRVREMLDHGASVGARAEQHMTTALHWAVSMGHIDVVEVRACSAKKKIECSMRAL